MREAQKINMQKTARMKKELQMLSQTPPHGISCWEKDDKIDELEAQILGGDGTPYEGGLFKLEIQIPERYPFEPPKVRFITPIYHPNIDTGGRICLDTLKMPPKGAWKPCLNISTVLTSIQLLMAEPNPDDPLMTDISDEFKYNKTQFILHAKETTEKYAMEHKITNSQNLGLANNIQGKVYDANNDSQTEGKRKPPVPMVDLTNKRFKDS